MIFIYIFSWIQIDWLNEHLFLYNWVIYFICANLTILLMVANTVCVLSYIIFIAMHQQFVFQWAVFLQIYELLIIKTFSFVKKIFMFTFILIHLRTCFTTVFKFVIYIYELIMKWYFILMVWAFRIIWPFKIIVLRKIFIINLLINWKSEWNNLIIY